MTDGKGRIEMSEMTPEKLAAIDIRQLCKRLNGSIIVPLPTENQLIRRINKAVRAAVETEIERCIEKIRSCEWILSCDRTEEELEELIRER